MALTQARPDNAHATARRISVLGATGSIGGSTLDLVRRNPDRFELVALTANSSVAELAALVREFAPETAVVADPAAGAALRDAVGGGTRTEIGCGTLALAEAAARPADLIVAGIVGSAGLDATLRGVPQLSVPLTDAENGALNPLGVNCLRSKPPAGRIVWGARTLQGDDRFASEWKYVPTRRTALYIEESLYRGTQWVVFEPNDEPLWAQIRLNVGAFMHGLFRQGAFQGSKPADAYLVKCDKESTTQDDINRGIVNIVVGFAPLKPAEFVIIKLQQLAGQSQA